MSDIKNKFDSAKDKIMGRTKENVGKATGSEETELKGKVQSQKGDLKEKLGNVKEKIAKKINDVMDKKEENKEN
ncbi:CsbD family protein [Clostridium algoriphilum]|uniref:CsbD family protein n=1 Tax=Clostridium algoriphilum TaxID=198347 RepID=UPI001CF4438D|nr:CsbD family protein [Clostridium algoriphilum]MCB2294952.1 CsbD family protein [Clostridium algoriphilum]